MHIEQQVVETQSVTTMLLFERHNNIEARS